MDSDQAQQGAVSREEAKRRLIEEAPAPLEVLMRDPADLIRKHPREAMAIAAAAGIILAASPKIRRAAIDATMNLASVFLK